MNWLPLLIATVLVLLSWFAAFAWSAWRDARKALRDSETTIDGIRRLDRELPLKRPKQRYAGVPERHRLS